MKTLLLHFIALGFSAMCSAQQKEPDTSKVKFTPPVIVKDNIAKKESGKAVKFIPPVIVKDKPLKHKKGKKSEAVKFTPPVIVKDPNK